MLLVICIIAGLFLGPLKQPVEDAFTDISLQFYFSAKDAEVSDEEMEMIYEMSPVDDENIRTLYKNGGNEKTHDRQFVFSKA